MRRALALAALLAAPAAFAQEAPEPFDPYERGTITLEVENDLFAFGGEDDHYTSGLRLSWVSAELSETTVPQWSRAPFSWWPGFDLTGTRRVAFAVGQNIYTPTDTDRIDPDPTDRPYAGWTYIGVSLNSQTARRMDTVELDIGIVGPAAGGRFVQNEVHSLIGVDEARGWSHQLHNEPGIMLIGERRYRLVEQTPVIGGVNGDLIGFFGASLGNIQTYGNVGFVVRIGDNLQADFGPPRIRPSLPGSHTFKPTDGFNWYLFAGADLRAVARDIFLDGNTFRDSPSVDKKHFVGDFEAGLALSYGSVRTSFTYIFRTEEFHGQHGNEKFGSISLTWVF